MNKKINIPFKTLSKEDKIEINSHSVNIQLCIQALLSEEILTHRHDLRKSKFFKQKIKQLFNDAENVIKRNDIFICQTFGEYLDDYDDSIDEWLKEVSENRKTIYHLITNYYNKQNLSDEIVVISEYLKSIASVVSLVMKNIEKTHKDLNITTTHLKDFNIKRALIDIFEMTNEVRKKIEYKPINVSLDNDYRLSIISLVQKIRTKLYNLENNVISVDNILK